MLSRERRPKWKIEIYDIRSSTGDTINDIVRGLTLETITGPRDFTSDITEYRLNETAGDFATSGVTVPSLDLTLPDPGDGEYGIFDPVHNSGPTELGRFLRRGNVVRLREGDSRVDEDDWPITFTGKLVGQAGVNINRTGGGQATVSVKALGRENDFLNVSLTTRDYLIGESMNAIGTDIAQADMGLDASEIEFSSWGATQLNGHLSLQFIEIPPLVAIAGVMMGAGVMPRFNGEGKLTQSDGLITQNPDRVYTNRRLITSIVRPFSDVDPVNCVLILGLDADQIKISQPIQDLISDLHITTGYFTNDEEIDIFWTEDRRLLAEDIVFEVIKSANGGISFLGGGESFVTIPASIGTGTIGATLTISTGYAPYILVAVGNIYISLAAIPDAVLAFGGGVTVSIGRIIQALALAIILILMTKIGKGQYRFRGAPFDFVYLELRGQHESPGLTTETRKKVQIKNQTLQTQDIVDTVAKNTYDRQQSLGSIRQVIMLPDLKLTPDDVFELPGTDLEQYQIQAQQRTGRRDAAGAFSSFATLTVAELSAIGLE